MADGADVMAKIERKKGVEYPVLVPNIKGYDRAKLAGATEVAVFASASESFSQKNINCSIAQSLERFEEIFEKAKEDGTKIRGYISCIVGCPYEGKVNPLRVAELTEKLYQKGCYEISLGDTIGVGTPGSIYSMISETKKRVPVEVLAGHYHDTYGQALSNILTSLYLGVSTFDSSISGLGGCPYAKGATGNIATGKSIIVFHHSNSNINTPLIFTEEVIYMLNGLNIKTGVNLDSLVEISKSISEKISRPIGSRVTIATLSKQTSCTNTNNK